MTHLSRRELLLSGLGLGMSFGTANSLSFLFPSLAQAKPQVANRFFVMLTINGGWDVTLALDPWLSEKRPRTEDLFIEYTADKVIRPDGIPLGPAAASLAPHAKDITILNGVLVSENDNGHPAAISYMATANGAMKAADLAIEIGNTNGAGSFGVIASSNLKVAPRKVPYLRGRDILSTRHEPDASAAIASTVRSGKSPLERAIDDVVASENSTRRLLEILNEMEKQTPQLEDEHVVAACFLAGASRQAKLDLSIAGAFLDTHGGHEGVHLAALTKYFEKVSSIFKTFKSLPFGTSGESLFDRTTFMVVSEFSRTPALNGSKGKDHNPILNSVLFAGAGIQKNKVINKSLLIGATDSATGRSYHMASPFRYDTGQAATSRAGADFIYPENVGLSVAAACGCDLTSFGSVPRGTKAVTGLVP